MPERLADFHLLRPEWLWGLLPALGLLLLARWRDDPTRPWRGLIEPHLLRALRVEPRGGNRFRPVHLVVVALVLGSLGAAGPSWEREPSPLTEDRAPLVIALDLSPSMLAIDVLPTRLERAKEKIRDLLARRAGARTGLVVYAATAHLVMPPTDDAQALETYLAALEPGLMPVPGENAAAALARAQRILDRDATPGSILFLTDGIEEPQRAAFRQHAATRREALLVLGVGTSEGGPIREGSGFATDAAGRRLTARLDREGLEDLARETGAFVATATLDARDVDRLQARIQSHLEAAREAEPTARWRDAGWTLTLPVALLVALWFRRGWTVRWTAVALLVLGGAPGARAQERGFVDLWLTPDQQGRLAFERGDFAAAAVLFEDPLWRGVACLRAGDWDGAIDAFARRDTPEAFLGLGNAYARCGDLERAVEAYAQALERRPGWPEAEENRALVAALIPKPEQDDDAPPGEPTFGADQVEFDEKGEKGERGEIDPGLLSREQMGEIWLRGLSTSPAAFLRQKFAIQAAEDTATPGSGDPW